MEATSYEEDTIFFLQIYLSEIISANPVSASETLLSETTLTWLEFAEVARGATSTGSPDWSGEEGLSWEDSFEEPSK